MNYAELLHNIRVYQQLRRDDNPQDLGSYDAMEQRLIEADHIIQILAKSLTETLRRERHNDVA